MPSCGWVGGRDNATILQDVPFRATIRAVLHRRVEGLGGTFLAVLALGGGGVIVLTAALLRALARVAPVPLDQPREIQAQRRR